MVQINLQPTINSVPRWHSQRQVMSNATTSLQNCWWDFTGSGRGARWLGQEGQGWPVAKQCNAHDSVHLPLLPAGILRVRRKDGCQCRANTTLKHHEPNKDWQACFPCDLTLEAMIDRNHLHVSCNTRCISATASPSPERAALFMISLR